MSMLDDLAAMIRSVEDARLVIVCHPDDEASVRMAVEAVAAIAPRIETNPHTTQPGEAIVVPAATEQQAIVP